MLAYLITPGINEVFQVDDSGKTSIVDLPLPKPIDIDGVELVSRFLIAATSLNGWSEAVNETSDFFTKCLLDPELLGDLRNTTFATAVERAAKFTKIQASIYVLMKDVTDQVWLVHYKPHDGISLTSADKPLLLSEGQFVDIQELKEQAIAFHKQEIANLEAILDHSQPQHGLWFLRSLKARSSKA